MIGCGMSARHYLPVRFFEVFLLEIRHVTTPEIFIGVIAGLAALIYKHFFGGGLSWTDAASVLIPAFWVASVLGVWLTFKTARSMRCDDLRGWENWQPKIQGSSYRPDKPSLLPIALIATIVAILFCSVLFASVIIGRPVAVSSTATKVVSEPNIPYPDQPKPEPIPSVLKRPHFILDDEVGMHGELPANSLVYRLNIDFTLKNEGEAAAHSIRIYGGGAPLASLSSFQPGLDVSLSTEINPGHSFEQRYTVTETFIEGQVLPKDYSPTAALVLVITYKGLTDRIYRDEFYTSCCGLDHKPRYLSEPQKNILAPLFMKAFPVNR